MTIRQKEMGDTSKGISVCKGPGARALTWPLQSSLEYLWGLEDGAVAMVQAKKKVKSLIFGEIRGCWRTGVWHRQAYGGTSGELPEAVQWGMQGIIRLVSAEGAAKLQDGEEEAVSREWEEEQTGLGEWWPQFHVPLLPAWPATLRALGSWVAPVPSPHLLVTLVTSSTHLSLNFFVLFL